jgi:glycosyltransferase involved in cell wall biosynthesis
MVRDLAEDLATDGHDVVVLTLRPEGSAPARCPSNGVTVHEVELPGPWVFDASWHGSGALTRMRFHLSEAYRPGIARDVAAMLADFSPDLVNTHNIAGFGTAAWSAARAALVHTMHDYQLLCPRTAMYRDGRQCSSPCLDCRIATVPRRHPRRRPDAFTTVSEHVRRVHLDAGVLRPSDRVGVFPSGVSVEVPRRRLEKMRRIGFMGRLEPGKGLPVLLEAITVDPELRDLEVVIAGRGTSTELASLDSFRSRGIAIRYIGYVPADEFLRQVDCVCVPTQWAEAFGRVAAEARMAGIPVIASRTGGLLDALAGYEHAVLVDDFASPVEWAGALRNLRTSFEPRSVGGVTRPEAPEVARRYVAFYKEVLGRS